MGGLQFHSSVLYLVVESREGAGAMGFTEQRKGHFNAE